MRNIVKVLVVLTFLVWGTAAGAAVIFSNGGIGSNGQVSDTDTSQTTGFAADDFSLAAGANVITGIQWTGLYAFNNSPLATDNFTIQFFVNAAGVPAVAPFLSLPIGNVPRVDTGVNASFGSDIFSYSANVAPIPLAPGTTFWMSIFNNTAADTNDNWFWGMTDAAGNGAFRSDQVSAWTTIGFRTDFTLTGPLAVSEPSSLALLSIAVIGLLGWRRKQAM
jgi:hypothetical protein